MYSKHIYENVYLSVSYDFSKFDGSKKIKVWHSEWYHPMMGLFYRDNTVIFGYIVS